MCFNIALKSSKINLKKYFPKNNNSFQIIEAKVFNIIVKWTEWKLNSKNGAGKI
jgi:hypothetical protein